MLLIYYNINELRVGSNLIFCCNYLATLLFFCYKAPVQHDFLAVFTSIFRKNRKKYDNFLQFFLLVYQLVRRKLKK